MSKSDPNPKGTVYLTDEPNVIMKKFKSAITDSEMSEFPIAAMFMYNLPYRVLTKAVWNTAIPIASSLSYFLLQHITAYVHKFQLFPANICRKYMPDILYIVRYRHRPQLICVPVRSQRGQLPPRFPADMPVAAGFRILPGCLRIRIPR